MRVIVAGGVARLLEDPGLSGQPGEAGPAGDPGQAGLAGDPGQVGLAGDPGQAGLAGDPGQVGPAGDPGQVGPAAAAGAIAGSTATLADVVRHAIAAGLPVPDVAAAASTTPARVLGLTDRTAALRPGLAADLVVCDDDLRPRAVMRQGEWLAVP